MKSGNLIILLMSLLLVLAVCQDALAAEADAGEGGGNSFAWHSLVEPLGITTLTCLLLTFLAGVFRRRLGRRFRKIHFALAAITVALALSHGLLVIILYG